MHTCVILKPCEITVMIYFFVLGTHYPLFWKSMLMRKKRFLRLFLILNILLFWYQIILILNIIASFYEKITPDCFVNLNV